MRKAILLLTAVLSAATCPGADARTWTDSTGQQRVEARFITAQFGKIWLLRTDGQTFGVAPEELSEADQGYVRQVVREREARRAKTENPAGRVAYGAGRQLCLLEDQDIAESSGLACSRRLPGFFWTHNDSGGDARAYLFDMKGRKLGSCELENTFAFDFEDMFSFHADGRNYLVLCDVGNNGRAAGVQMLHVIEEPPFDPQRGLTADRAAVVETIHFSYADDHRDCEAVGIDPTSKTILLVSKQRDSACYVYALPWPESNGGKAFVARQIATLQLPAVTSLDVSPDGRRAVLLTYENAYEFVRGQDETWDKAFTCKPREIIVPERIQGESICYGSDGKSLFLTSEKLPTPLLTVPALE